MLKNIVFIILLFSVALLSVWTLSRPDSKQDNASSIESFATKKNRTVNNDESNPRIDDADNRATRLTSREPVSSKQRSWADQVAADIQQDLNTNRRRAAVSRINDIYSLASPAQLARFKTIILQHSETLIRNKSEADASALLKDYAQTYDDADAWNRLSALSAATQQWDIAVNSLLKLSLLQFEPKEYQATLKRLIQASSHVRAGMESRGDELGIVALYQRIYDQHPDYPRFQLELAQAHLRLDDQIAARPYLEALQYDPEMGALAKQKLEAINATLNASIQQPKSEPTQLTSREQIMVPLLRSGNSYLIDVSINTRPMRLLLDTGASITSLSRNTIKRLGLKPTGRTIKLSTANGLTNAKLYYADSINLGRLHLNNLTVAEVEFGHNSRLQGLLGTDVLNQMKNRYSYLIDNQQNALIFRSK